MWLFQRDDTFDEDEDDCEFVLAGGGGADAKYLVMRGEGAETGHHRRNIIAAQNSDPSEDWYGDDWHSTHLEPLGKSRVAADP